MEQVEGCAKLMLQMTLQKPYIFASYCQCLPSESEQLTLWRNLTECLLPSLAILDGNVKLLSERFSHIEQLLKQFLEQKQALSTDVAFRQGKTNLQRINKLHRRLTWVRVPKIYIIFSPIINYITDSTNPDQIVTQAKPYSCHCRQQLQTFSAPHNSTVSSSSTTHILKYGVCIISLSNKPFSRSLQPEKKAECVHMWQARRHWESTFCSITRLWYNLTCNYNAIYDWLFI